MSYSATVVPVMIASPSDVEQERRAARDAILDWNYTHSKREGLVLMPAGWETHAAPDLGGRAQSLINSDVLEQCDLLVAIFWTRIGTPTGNEESGSVEEIRTHVSKGKPAMVYFSKREISPDSIDNNQYAALKSFKSWCQDRGLIEQFSSLEQFSAMFARQLQIKINNNKYLQSIKQGQLTTHSVGAEGKVLGREGLRVAEPMSSEALELLGAAAKDRFGLVLRHEVDLGLVVAVGNTNFGESGNARVMAKWSSAVDRLVAAGYLKQKGKDLFAITDRGYEFVGS